MSDERPTIIQTGGNGGWAIAVVILVVVVAGILYFSGAFHIGRSGNVNVNVEAPAASAPAPAAPAPAAPKTPAAPPAGG